MLKMSPAFVRSAALGLALGVGFCGSAFAQNTLTAMKVAQAPKLESLAADPAWASAPQLKFQIKNGQNFPGGTSSVAMKAAYTADTLYMLIQYSDATLSARRSPYVKQADGTWKKLSDPDNVGGDNNKYYEDKLGLIWNINSSIKGFDSQGCMATCHLGETKPYGNKYTASEGELGDIWHVKSVRTGSVGQTDDQYVDHTRYDKEKSPEAGRRSDPRTGGGYADVKLVNGKPEFMSRSAKAANKGGTYWLLEEDKVPFDDSKFVAGDEIASIMVAKLTGDRGDIATQMGHKDGMWTVALSRKLVTQGKFDVQFNNLDNEYAFGVAAFDNAQVRHAFHFGAMKLKFAK